MVKVKNEHEVGRVIRQAAYQWYKNPENRKKVEARKRENDKQETRK